MAGLGLILLIHHRTPMYTAQALGDATAKEMRADLADVTWRPVSTPRDDAPTTPPGVAFIAALAMEADFLSYWTYAGRLATRVTSTASCLCAQVGGPGRGGHVGSAGSVLVDPDG